MAKKVKVTYETVGSWTETYNLSDIDLAVDDPEAPCNVEDYIDTYLMGVAAGITQSSRNPGVVIVSDWTLVDE